jgi:hypothetical protein
LAVTRYTRIDKSTLAVEMHTDTTGLPFTREEALQRINLLLTREAQGAMERYARLYGIGET